MAGKLLVRRSLGEDGRTLWEYGIGENPTERPGERVKPKAGLPHYSHSQATPPFDTLRLLTAGEVTQGKASDRVATSHLPKKGKSVKVPMGNLVPGTTEANIPISNADPVRMAD